METLNQKTLSFPAKIFTHAFAALGIVLILAACGKNDGGAVAVPPVYGSGCGNCAGTIPTPALLTTFKAQSFDGNVALMNMQLYAQSTGITAVASGNNYKGYSGPIATQGQLVVRATQYDYVPGTSQMATACVLPAGTHIVQTQTVGQMGYGGVDIYFPSLIVAGGAIELKVEAPSPMGLLDGGQTLWANVKVVRVNGILCSANFHGDFK